jgi:hypothetical protein
MALDLVQFGADLVRGNHLVVDVAGFGALGGQVAVIVFEGFDCVVLGRRGLGRRGWGE